MTHFKERLTPPIPSDHDVTQRDHLIEFFHPAYPVSAPPLLSLVAVDVAGNGTLGIDYDFAKASCGIVANNRWDDATYIATKNQVEGSCLNRVPQPEDGILPILASGMAYYFVVDHPTNRYPVVPSFDHWRFPHTELPAPWDALCFASTISVTSPLSPKPLPAHTQEGRGWALDKDEVENKDEDDSLILLQSIKRQKII
ncbi:hypothetical protein HD806DRAFT_517366 [Xylariaceae sp. AK1471]|nr:hypothetical protein HD806DRAFT_517366 [Xylariaceae sp. AK1471]